jgi:protein AATF/BFR2
LLEEDAVGSGFRDSPGPSASESQSEAGTSEEDLSQSADESGNAREWSPSQQTKDAPKDANHEADLRSTIRQRRDEDKRKGRAISQQLVGPLC